MRHLLPVLVGVLFMGCGNPDDMNALDTDPLKNPNPQVVLGTDSFMVTTGEFEVPVGDSFECFYTGYTTDRELAIDTANGQQGPGGHHITVYYSTQPVQPVGHHPCRDDEMVNWRQVAGANVEGQTGGEGTIGLSEGLAMKLPKGRQIVLQIHYINARPTPMRVNDWVKVHSIDPAQVRAYANNMFINDADFEIKPGETVEVTSTCQVPRDLNIVMLLGHQHELGKHYKLELMDGATVKTIYETDWQESYASHPPVTNFRFATPFQLTTKMKLRQTCRWNNSTDKNVYFPREMCVAFMYYYPDMGELECPIVSRP